MVRLPSAQTTRLHPYQLVSTVPDLNPRPLWDVVEEKNQAEKSAAFTKNSQKGHFLLQYKITPDATLAVTDKVCYTCRDKDYIPNKTCHTHVKMPRNLRSKIPLEGKLHFNTIVSFPRIQLGFNPPACRDMLFPLNKNKTTTVSTHLKSSLKQNWVARSTLWCHFSFYLL